MMMSSPGEHADCLIGRRGDGRRVCDDVVFSGTPRILDEDEEEEVEEEEEEEEVEEEEEEEVEEEEEEEEVEEEEEEEDYR